MLSKLFRKKPDIPPTWIFQKEENESLIDSFVNQVKQQLRQSFPDGVFEYEDDFVEFYVGRNGALCRFRFQIRKWSPTAIDIESFGFSMAFDQLEVTEGIAIAYDDRYYRLRFKLGEIIHYNALEGYKWGDFETQKEGDFVGLFNKIGFVWVNCCLKMMDQIHSIEAVLQFCEQMKSEKKCYGLSDNEGLAYLHCQCLMILKKEWQSVFHSYEASLSAEQYERLKKGLDGLIQRYGISGAQG